MDHSETGPFFFFYKMSGQAKEACCVVSGHSAAWNLCDFQLHEETFRLHMTELLHF